jgi:PAS domain S-box-containing protein
MHNGTPYIKPTILYVDDESINLRLFKISFKDNYDITTAQSGEDGLKLIEENHHFDIIISDQRMPGMNGTQFMIEAKKTLSQSKYILLTGYTDIEALERAINDVGLWQYVKKPWEPSNLKFIIENAFSSLKTEKENKIISTALKQSEERLNLALTGTNVGVWDWDLKRSQIYFSPTWKEMLGYEIDEIDNQIRTLQNLIHPEDYQKMITHLKRYINGNIKKYEIEYRIKHKNGDYIHILSRGRGIKNNQDEFERITGTNIDLTEKYKAEQQIKELNGALEERVERRTNALKLLNIQLIQRNKFEHLISKISSELVGVQLNEINTQLSRALNDIIEFNGSANAFILKIKDNKFHVKHENSNTVNDSNINEIFDKREVNTLPVISDYLLKTKPYILANTEDLLGDNSIEKKIFKRNNVSSLLIVPFFLKNQLKGGLGISNQSVKRDWSQEDVNLLKFVGEIFMNVFERNDTEYKLITRDKEISKANHIISKNERKAKLLQNIASIANSPLQVEDALHLSHEIIISQGDGVSGFLFKLESQQGTLKFNIENIFSKTQEEKTLLKNFFETKDNELDKILNELLKNLRPSVHDNIKFTDPLFNSNSNSISFSVSTIPILVENDLLYAYLTLSPHKNSIFNELGILNDISREISFFVERDRTKKELKKALEKEKELGELKSQFVSMASHQFRTPLTVIQSNIELFQMLASKIDSNLKGKFDKISKRIQTEVARLGDLMNDVLLLGKLNANVLLAEIQLGNILQDTTEVVNRLNSIQPDKRKATISIEGMQRNIAYDKKLLAHALSNLIDNAFKYSRNKRSPEIRISFKKQLKITVVDFGRGIPNNELNKLFQPFFRSNSAQDIEGTGLGLVICKRYIELQKGTLSVESILNKKTTFTISLPLKLNEQDFNN